MDNDKAGPRALTLEQLVHQNDHTFTTPSKRINDGDDLNFFLTSTAYRDLTLWILQLNRSMFPTKARDGMLQTSDLTLPPPFSPAVQHLRSMLDDLTSLIDQAPPSTGPRRFGNVAFRDWCRLAGEQADSLIQTHLAETLRLHSHDRSERTVALVDELKSYLLGSFGSPQRLDYGTGHELSFLAFLGCLWKLSSFQPGEERAIVMGVIQPYLGLVRKLIMTYTLEPAGSHGVWGLDDHSFLPYIFGSAQLGPAIDSVDYSKPVPTEGSLPSAPTPSTVTKKDVVADYKDTNMYFSAIQFIYDVKRGPFWEHSPILYDISGIKDGWGKINNGMLKMWAAEVLGKFPVVQHFPFGSLFNWERDEEAVKGAGRVHAAQQPKSMDAPVPAPAPRNSGSAGGVGGVGTAAPWARNGGSAMPQVPQMQASTGVPSTRAPWAGVQRAPPAAPVQGMTPTAAPWAATQRPAARGGSRPSTVAQWGATQQPQGGGTAMPPTAAPWAKKDSGSQR